MKIGIIGVGNIGSAILKGLISAEKAEEIYISDVRKERLRMFEHERCVKICDNNEDVAKNADVVIIAVKPSDVKGVLTAIKHALEGKLLISVAAGISTSTLESYLGMKSGEMSGESESGGGSGGSNGGSGGSKEESRDGGNGGENEREGREMRGGMRETHKMREMREPVRVVRVMPNVGAVVGAAVSAICRGRYADDTDEKVAKEIFSAIGDVYAVDEKDMDAITGLSGSGIAFVATVIDALADGGVHEGLPRDLSLKIAAKTAEGAAKMISAGFSPEKIREITTSPGGTTIRGIARIEKHGVRAAMMDAVVAAAERSREISLLTKKQSES